MKLTTGPLSRRTVLRGSGAVLAALGVAGGAAFGGAQKLQAAGQEQPAAALKAGEKPTVVLVHGAFADSSSWNDIMSTLLGMGYPVVAPSNPLRGLTYDSAYIVSTLKSIAGPIVLVGHSYGGSVISAASASSPRVRALVFVAGFAPQEGESAADLSGRFPGGTLGPSLAPPVPLGDGTSDLYIQQSLFRAQFCADVPEPQAARMGASQRPCTDLALSEGAGAPGWKSIPSWFVWGELDKNIPAAAHRFMAERAKAREAVEIKGGSHVVGISNADTVAAMILRAAKTIK